MAKLGYQCTGQSACSGHGATVKMSDYFGS